MVKLRIGRHGVIILVLLFLLLGAEDVLIWYNTGALPAIEFFVAMLVVLGIVALAIYESVVHPPPRR